MEIGFSAVAKYVAHCQMDLACMQAVASFVLLHTTLFDKKVFQRKFARLCVTFFFAFPQPPQ